MEMEESQPTSEKRPYGKIRFALAILNTLIGLTLILSAAYALFMVLIPAVKIGRETSIFFSEFDKVARIAIAPAAILLGMLSGGVLIVGGIMGLARSTRAFRWSVCGWLMVCLPLISNYFDFPISAWDLRISRAVTQTSILLAIAVTFVAVNYVLGRRYALPKAARPRHRFMSGLLLAQLIIMFGGVQVGTWAAIKVFQHDTGMPTAAARMRIADGVTEYREDWGNMQTVNFPLGRYMLAIPGGSLEGTRHTHDKYDDYSSDSVLLACGDLTILVITHGKNIFADAFDKDPMVGRVLFPGITDSFERYKKIMNAAPADFSLLMSRNECAALLAYLDMKSMMTTIGEPYDDGMHEIRTQYLRGVHKKMKTPLVVELFDPIGHNLTVMVQSKTRGEFTPEQQRLVKNIIASIRSRTPADSIAEALSH
jgi:hypothetical protein